MIPWLKTACSRWAFHPSYILRQDGGGWLPLYRYLNPRDKTMVQEGDDMGRANHTKGKCKTNS